MLRITKLDDGTCDLRIKVEGRLVAEWVPVLETETLALLEQCRQVQLNLAGVNFVDATGVAALRRLVTRGVSMINATPLVKALLNIDTLQ